MGPLHACLSPYFFRFTPPCTSWFISVSDPCSLSADTPASWLALLMVLMVLAPVLVRALEQNGLEGAAWAMALAGYSWMGFIFLAFVLFAALFCWDGVMLASGKLVPGASALALHGPKSAAALLLLVSRVLRCTECARQATCAPKRCASKPQSSLRGSTGSAWCRFPTSISD